MTFVLDIVGALLIAAGSFFCLAAAIAQIRFPDVLARMHAATKPQAFGLLLLLAGVACVLRTWQTTAFLTVVVILQLITAPISSHMVARTAYRNRQWDHESAVIDELEADWRAAGFTEAELQELAVQPEPGGDPEADESAVAADPSRNPLLGG